MPLTLDRITRAFEQAITFDAFVDGTVNFTDQYRENYDAVDFSEDDLAAIASIPEDVNVLAIVEDWCPDVVATLPVVQRLAERSDRVNLHVLIRGEATQDVANAYPYEGRSHIPTYVFFSANGPELGVIVERTPELHTAVKAFIAGFFAEHPEIDREGFPGNLTPEAKEELLTRSGQLRRDLRSVERSTLVRDVVAIASGDASASTPGVRTTAAAAV